MFNRVNVEFPQETPFRSITPVVEVKYLNFRPQVFPIHLTASNVLIF